MDSASKFALPDEIWSRIFTYYLPLHDLKNVRSTCHGFHELCDNACIQRKEEIVFNGNINTVSAILSLSNTCRRVWNIKLDRVDVTDDTILPFFEKQGTHIRSLIFQNCKFAPGIFKPLIEHCVSLCNIALIFSENPDENCFVEHILNDFKALENESVVCPSVTDFTFIVPFKNSLSNLKFLRFFTIFPSIQKLDLETDVSQEFDQLSTISADVRCDAVFSLSSIYSQLYVMRDQLRKLRLKFENNPSYYSCFSVERLIQISNIEMRNLKEFSLNWINLEPDVTIMHPFTELRNLTHLDFNISCRFCTSTLVSTFLQLLLSTSLSLYSLKFTHYNFRIDRKLFQAFVRSKLKTLSLHMKDDYPSMLSTTFKPSALENTLLPNFNLEDVYFERESRDLMLLFSTYFRNLKTVVFPEVHEAVMQNIFEHQTKIYHLTLLNCRRWPFKKCVFRSISTFQQWLEKATTTMKRELEYLQRLHIRDDEYSLSNFMLKEFKFPELKFLSVSIHYNTELNPFDCEQLWQHIHKLPQLHYVKLQLPVGLSFQQWLTLFHSLHNLRNFYLEDWNTVLLHDVEYRQLFDLFPSLRIIEHRLKNSLMTCAKYFNDLTTKTVIDISKSSDSTYLGPYF